MKKILAVLLALAMIFSFATFVSAKEIKEGDVWFGPKNYKVLANPGEEATFTIELKASLDADQKEMFDKDGTLVIPFNVMANDASMSPVQGVELTDEAKAAGVVLTHDTNYELYGLEGDDLDETWFLGTVTMPASYLFSEEAFDVLNVTVKVSDEWIVGQYTGIAETPIDISFMVGGMAISETFEPAKIVTKDGDEVVNEVYIDNMTDYGSATVAIDGKPYEPTKKEKRKEWWRKLAVKILEFNNKIIAWLMNGPLAPAPWNK